MNCWPLVLLLLFFSPTKCVFFSYFFKAGLSVGDMILCVNKDELLGADYDTVSFFSYFLLDCYFPLVVSSLCFPFRLQAASVLKKAEGILTIVVSNPKGGAAASADAKKEDVKPSKIFSFHFLFFPSFLHPDEN